MALIVEDGTAKVDAETYAAVADYKTYADARGVSYATLSDTQIEQNLRKGADYIGQAYSLRWAGLRATTTQALDWPRVNVPIKDAPGGLNNVPQYYAPNRIPAALVHANIEAAIRAASDDLAADLDRGILAESVGPISTTYDPNSPQQKRYPVIEMLLNPFLKAAGGVVLVRG